MPDRKGAILIIIQDDPALRELLAMLANHLGHTGLTAQSLAEGWRIFEHGGIDVVFLAASLPDGNALDALPEFLSSTAPPEVIVIADREDAKSAEAAIRLGAWDYIRKPATAEEYRTHLQRALEFRTSKLAEARMESFSRDPIIGNSPALLSCLEMSAKAASSEANVLILGETGTGKELFARAVHDNSPRKDGPFVVVDCAAIPDNLVESLLFGYEKGAFTGADMARAGLIRQARGGTLFLDEVGELPPALQASFLRVLQERTFRPLGGSREIAGDFRLVAATNRDLDAAVANGRFRQDLLYRLKSFILELPPLRKRLEDITPLARYAMHVLARRYGMKPREVSPEFFVALKTFEWPGNVRELINTLEITMTAHMNDPVLYPRHLPVNIRVRATLAGMSGRDGKAVPEAAATAEPKTPPILSLVPPPRAVGPDASPLPPLSEYREQALQQAEESYLRTLVSRSGSDMRAAASVAGLSLSRLYALLRKHGIRKQF